jgi:hypothetical protein
MISEPVGGIGEVKQTLPSCNVVFTFLFQNTILQAQINEFIFFKTWLPFSILILFIFDRGDFQKKSETGGQ